MLEIENLNEFAFGITSSFSIVLTLLQNDIESLMNFKGFVDLLNVLSKSESVKFSLIESMICLFTDSSVNKYFSLLNQSIFAEIISEI